MPYRIEQVFHRFSGGKSSSIELQNDVATINVYKSPRQPMITIGEDFQPETELLGEQILDSVRRSKVIDKSTKLRTYDQQTEISKLKASRPNLVSSKKAEIILSRKIQNNLRQRRIKVQGWQKFVNASKLRLTKEETSKKLNHSDVFATSNKFLIQMFEYIKSNEAKLEEDLKDLVRYFYRHKLNTTNKRRNSSIPDISEVIIEYDVNPADIERGNKKILPIALSEQNHRKDFEGILNMKISLEEKLNMIAKKNPPAKVSSPRKRVQEAVWGSELAREDLVSDTREATTKQMHGSLEEISHTATVAASPRPPVAPMATHRNSAGRPVSGRVVVPQSKHNGSSVAEGSVVAEVAPRCVSATEGVSTIGGDSVLPTLVMSLDKVLTLGNSHTMEYERLPSKIPSPRPAVSTMQQLRSVSEGGGGTSQGGVVVTLKEKGSMVSSREYSDSPKHSTKAAEPIIYSTNPVPENERIHQKALQMITPDILRAEAEIRRSIEKKSEVRQSELVAMENKLNTRFSKEIESCNKLVDNMINLHHSKDAQLGFTKSLFLAQDFRRKRILELKRKELSKLLGSSDASAPKTSSFSIILQQKAEDSYKKEKYTKIQEHPWVMIALEKLFESSKRRRKSMSLSATKFLSAVLLLIIQDIEITSDILFQVIENVVAPEDHTQPDVFRTLKYALSSANIDLLEDYLSFLQQREIHPCADLLLDIRKKRSIATHF